MLDKELSYFKGGGLGDNMGLGKARLGRIFLTACPSVDTAFCRSSRCMRVPMSIGLSLMFLFSCGAVIVKDQSTDSICKTTLVIAPTALLD